MTARRCPTHNRPTRDATLCRQCVTDLDTDLAKVPSTVEDLITMLTRQTTTGDRVGGASSERLLPFDQRASKLLQALHRALAGWVWEVRIPARPDGPVCDQCRHPSCDRIRLSFPVANLPVPMAAWLQERVHRLAHYPAAVELAADLHEVLDDVTAALDRPERVYLGRCVTAGCVERDGQATDLYAEPGATVVVCPRCDREYDVWTRRRHLLTEAADRLATATEISRALTSLGEPVTPDRIYKWAERDRLEARGDDPETGHPRYRVGDVQQLLAAAELARKAKQVKAEMAEERRRKTG